jgi:hypothetical protein
MKRALFSVLMLIVVAGLVGCKGHNAWRRPACTDCGCAQASDGCQTCEGGCDNTGDGVCDESCTAAKGFRCRLCKEGLCKRGLCKERLGEAASEPVAAGPATGAVTYPYYTTRGPRDFLAKNPGSIGP